MQLDARDISRLAVTQECIASPIVIIITQDNNNCIEIAAGYSSRCARGLFIFVKAASCIKAACPPQLYIYNFVRLAFVIRVETFKLYYNVYIVYVMSKFARPKGLYIGTGSRRRKSNQRFNYFRPPDPTDASVLCFINIIPLR